MEREEAAATGLPLVTPEDLDYARLYREINDPAPRLAAVLGRLLSLAGVEEGRVALSGTAFLGEVHGACRRLEQASWSFVPGHEVMRNFRKTKDEKDLAGVRQAAAGTVAAFRRVAELLAAATPRDGGELWLEGERLSIGRLRSEATLTLARFGLDQPEGNLLAPGDEGGVPHSTGTDSRVLSEGESLVVDLFPRDRLFADCTRTFCVGEPSPDLEKAHRLVEESLLAAHRKARAGCRGWSLQEEVCRILGEAGYETPLTEPNPTTGYVHGLGHGVGYELHEYPSFSREAGAEGLLAEGDVFTLEPGLYYPDKGFGVRLEDLVYLGPEGPENLTPLPYDLDPRAWV
jgi:Xaa-Pro aminopeptidase